MFHINKIYIDHLHLHNDEKLDRIIELLTTKNEAELEEIIKKIKRTIRDIKSTPTK